MKRRDLFKKLGIAITGVIFAPGLVIKTITKTSSLIDIPFPIYTKPNDILIAAILHDGVSWIESPPGWELISQDPVERMLNMGIYWKRADGTEDRKVTFTSKKKPLDGRMYAYSGVKSIELK